MANNKKSEIENNTQSTNDNTQSPTQIDNTEIMKMMLDFQEQLNLMKEQNSLLQAENESLKSKVSDTEEEFDPNKLITIRNMYDGLELNLKINDFGNMLPLKKFGGTIKKRLIEVKDIVRLNQKFAEKGYFIIEDRELIEKEFDELVEPYSKVIDYKVLNQIQNLENKALGDIFKNSNSRYQRMIINKFVSEWTKGEDIKFRDQSKINLLSEISGVDIMAEINGIEVDDNLKNQYVKKE